MEQVLVADPKLYGPPGPHTPRWPPAPCVAAIHWWGRTADRLVLARPVWFKVAIWLEVLVQAPFYVVAIFAFLRRANWIRTPAIVYCTVLLTIMPSAPASHKPSKPHACPRRRDARRSHTVHTHNITWHLSRCLVLTSAECPLLSYRPTYQPYLACDARRPRMSSQSCSVSNTLAPTRRLSRSS